MDAEYGYVVNVDGAVVRDGEYLLIRRAESETHAAGLLGFPGGKLEAPPGSDDVIEATVRRELREEVGIEVGDVSYVHSSTFEDDGGSSCLNIITHCEYSGGEPRPRDPDEVASIHWLSPAEIRNNGAVPPFTEKYVDRLEGFRSRM